MKGVLPVPRPIFRRQLRPQDLNKASPEYLANITPEPIRDKSVPRGDSQAAEAVSWKARQAVMRRRNLRESLVELSHRKQKADKISALRGKQKREQREVLLTAPEREDERLTNPSVLQSDMPISHHVLPDPDREARLAQKRANVANAKAMQQADRRDKLHTLYVNASNFITTDKQLDLAVDRAFDDQEQFTNDAKEGLNIWNLGIPETVSELLGKANKDPRRQRAVEMGDSNKIIMKQRMKRVAEELTGGKMGEL